VDIVIDASAIIAVITNEVAKPLLINATTGVDLIAPHSIYWEIGNAFSAMFKQNRISQEQALIAVAAYKKIPIRYVDIELEEALAIAGDLKIYAYDAYLLRCALKYRCPLLTLDNGLKYVAGMANVNLVEVEK
jgi:predicted nucleic acid-binding protein